MHTPIGLLSAADTIATGWVATTRFSSGMRPPNRRYQCTAAEKRALREQRRAEQLFACFLYPSL